MDFLWRLKLTNQTHQRVSPFLHDDRQRLTWQQTFFQRVISLSTVRWFFSLLSEQWWRKRSADGLVTDLRVMQVRGPRVAGLLLEENLSGLLVVGLVREVGLITCERGAIGKEPDTSLSEVKCTVCNFKPCKIQPRLSIDPLIRPCHLCFLLKVLGNHQKLPNNHSPSMLLDFD